MENANVYISAILFVFIAMNLISQTVRFEIIAKGHQP